MEAGPELNADTQRVNIKDCPQLFPHIPPWSQLWESAAQDEQPRTHPGPDPS